MNTFQQGCGFKLFCFDLEKITSLMSCTILLLALKLIVSNYDINSTQWHIFMTHLKFITGFLTWKQTPEQYETLTVKGDLIISIPRSFEKFNIMWRLWQALVCFIPLQQHLNNSDWTRIWPMRWQNETCLVFLHKRRFRNSIFKVYLFDVNDGKQQES